MIVDPWNNLLKNEENVYKALAGGTGIPRLQWFGQECGHFALVQELLGPSLENLLAYCGGIFSVKTVLLLADQAISRISYMHRKGFLHRDIKPGNFVMGIGPQGNTLYAIDFGLATRYSDNKAGRSAFVGTDVFASLNSHHRGGAFIQDSMQENLDCANSRIGASWGDDLESLGYTLIYLAQGGLPWDEDKSSDKEVEKELIKQQKMSMSVATLCEGLPEEFATYMNYTRALGPEHVPNYAYLRGLFSHAFKARGFKYDHIFDWTERRFHELRDQAKPAPPTP